MSAAELEVSNRTELEADLRAGLWSDPATLPPRWFYDERGSRLFDEITALPEYYPTRAEHEILARRSHEIVRLTGARSLHELGAGTATKTRELLDALTAGGRSALYVPLDISDEVLAELESEPDPHAARANESRTASIAETRRIPPLPWNEGQPIITVVTLSATEEAPSGGTPPGRPESRRKASATASYSAMRPIASGPSTWMTCTRFSPGAIRASAS